jgi:hypothetical protein
MELDFRDEMDLVKEEAEYNLNSINGYTSELLETLNYKKERLRIAEKSVENLNKSKKEKDLQKAYEINRSTVNKLKDDIKFYEDLLESNKELLKSFKDHYKRSYGLVI